jgi:hypothetical protein
MLVLEAELGSQKLESVTENSALRTTVEFQKSTSYLSWFSNGRIIHFTLNRSILLNGRDTHIPQTESIKVGA